MNVCKQKLPPYLCLLKGKDVARFSESAPYILLTWIKFAVVAHRVGFLCKILSKLYCNLNNTFLTVATFPVVLDRTLLFLGIANLLRPE